MIKYSRLVFAAALFLLAAVFQLVLPVAMHAQQAENTSVISYQGSVKTNSGSPVTGDHLITTTLYSDANGTLSVWSGTYKREITGGVFTVLLGSGAYPLPVAQDFSKTLWIGVKIDGGEELKPLTQLTGAPYSVSIADKSVTKDKMAVDYVGSIMVNGKRITGKGTTLNLVDGLNTSLLYDEATHSLSLNSIGGGGIGYPTTQGVACTGPYWLTGGNPGTQTCQTFGSLDNMDVIMVAKGTEQMRMLGQQVVPAGSTGTFGILLPSSIANGIGVIFQGAGMTPNTYIHSFGGVTNFFAGNQAGNLAMTGTKNTGIGNGALTVNTAGYQNTACGYWALFNNADDHLGTVGHNNTAMGACALLSNTYGSNNTATGWGALDQNTTGGGNTANGSDALHDNTIGGGNSGFGLWALTSNTIGNNNAACGFGALRYNLIGNNNTAVGFEALYNNTGNYNTASGYYALYSNTYGNANTASGLQALYSNTTGNYNTASGSGALFYNTTGAWNTASGYLALYVNTTGNYNTASGVGALFNSNGSYNTASGYYALYSNTSGSYNTAMGDSALSSNTTGNNNTACGHLALYGNNMTGSDNTASGAYALFSNTTGVNNTASGYLALYSNTTGYHNTASGIQALYLNSTGSNNIANGDETLYGNTTGSENTASGYGALQNNATGANNTALGAGAGNGNTTGSNNTFVGYLADASANNLTDASAIGNGASVCASNTMVFGDANVVGWGFGVCPNAAHAIEVGTGVTNGNGAFLTLAGVWTNASSRSFKERFRPLDGAEVLSKIMALNVLGWYYKGTNEYHIGPIAEDFYSTFQTGNQDYPSETQRYVSSVDPAGVALIGVKELKKENEKMSDEINSLRKEVEEIKASLRK